MRWVVVALAIGASDRKFTSSFFEPFGSLTGLMAGSRADSASGNLRVRNSCEAYLYAVEISENDLLLGDRWGTDEERWWEPARELFPVVMVAVDEPEELSMISPSGLMPDLLLS